MTREERHEVYKKALESLKECAEEKLPLGLCYHLTTVTKWQYDAYEAMEEFFPEVFSHKPKKEYEYEWWWPSSDYKTRIKVLEDCIEKTK